MDDFAFSDGPRLDLYGDEATPEDLPDGFGLHAGRTG